MRQVVTVTGASAGVGRAVRGARLGLIARNLFEPQDEHRDHGSHGRFDGRAGDPSAQLWLSMNRGRLSLAAAWATGLASMAGVIRRRRDER